MTSGEIKLDTVACGKGSVDYLKVGQYRLALSIAPSELHSGGMISGR